MKTFFYIFLFVVVISIPITSTFDYVDELLAIISICFIILNYSRLAKEEKHIVILLILLIITGFVGTLNNRYQNNIFPILLDILGCVKCFVCFIFARHFCMDWDVNIRIQIIKYINVLLKPYIFFAFVFGILNLIVDIGMSPEIRMGLRGYGFIYCMSGTFSNLHYIFIFLLTANYFIFRTKTNLIFILMGLSTWCFTLKSRAILYVILYCLIFYFLVHKNKVFKLTMFRIITVISLALCVTFQQIEVYFIENDRMPRRILLLGGVETMVRNFPFGAGFATFGTDAAARYYSELYIDLGYENAYGLNPDDTSLAHDNYWPAIMGEFGIIGVVIIFLVLYDLYLLILKDYRDYKLIYSLVIFIFFSQLFSSIPTSIFFVSLTVYLFFFLPLVRFKKNHMLTR